MSVYYSDDLVTLHHGDCVEVMRSLPEASVDAVVTDPPYGLAFMGKQWDDAKRMVGQMAKGKEQRGALAYGGSHDRGYADHDANGFQLFSQAWATEALRVLKPGGHVLAFGGTRTWHRLAVAIEDAGFEVRDSIAWMYGSGFPKSLDVSKAIAAHEIRGNSSRRSTRLTMLGVNDDAAEDASGLFGKAKKTGRLADRTTTPPPTANLTPAAQQWQGWGTALKPAFEPIVVARKPLDGTVAENVLRHGTGALNIDGSRIGTDDTLGRAKGGWGNAAVGADNYGNFNSIGITKEGGRWPANVILDESQAAELDRQADERPARFFYVPKANASERPRDGDTAHPTVKPLDLMRYLVKLVTPPGGTVLEPFAGSGTTLEACVIEGFHVIGIELTEDYLPLIVQRLSKPIEQVLW